MRASPALGDEAAAVPTKAVCVPRLLVGPTALAGPNKRRQASASHARDRRRLRIAKVRLLLLPYVPGVWDSCCAGTTRRVACCDGAVLERKPVGILQITKRLRQPARNICFGQRRPLHNQLLNSSLALDLGFPYHWDSTSTAVPVQQFTHTDNLQSHDDEEHPVTTGTLPVSRRCAEPPLFSAIDYSCIWYFMFKRNPKQHHFRFPGNFVRTAVVEIQRVVLDFGSGSPPYTHVCAPGYTILPSTFLTPGFHPLCSPCLLLFFVASAGVTAEQGQHTAFL